MLDVSNTMEGVKFKKTAVPNRKIDAELKVD